MAWTEQTGTDAWRVRYRDDGHVETIPTVFLTREAAQDYIDDMATDQRRGNWIDPAGGRTTVNEFAPRWLDAEDVDIRTMDNKTSILNNHILPRWGTTELGDVTNLNSRTWRKTLLASGLAPLTVDGIFKQWVTMLVDAADEELIAACPIRRRRRGRRRHNHTTRPRKKVWAEPVDVLRLADQVAEYYHPSGAVLIIASAWTGSRLGELTGLQRPNLKLILNLNLDNTTPDSTDDNTEDTGSITIDPDIGALHEDDSGRLWLGPPKTEESARTIILPPFLVRLLHTHLTTHNHRHVFPAPDLTLHRRSNFSRRAVRPCADGNLHLHNPRTRLQPTKPGLTFHGLRHSHKTWMITDNIPEVAQAERLGHKIKDPVQDTYSHVAAEVERRLLQALQDRWDKATADIGHIPEWRAAAETA